MTRNRLNMTKERRTRAHTKGLLSYECERGIRWADANPDWHDARQDKPEDRVPCVVRTINLVGAVIYQVAYYVEDCETWLSNSKQENINPTHWLRIVEPKL